MPTDYDNSKDARDTERWLKNNDKLCKKCGRHMRTYSDYDTCESCRESEKIEKMNNSSDK